MKLLMLKGLPGSGKSTWAKQFVKDNKGWVRVNKDSLRKMTGCDYRMEAFTLRLRDITIQAALGHGFSVIVDDTNLHPKHEPRLLHIAREQNAEFEVKFFDTPLEQCIKNDLNRATSVGQKVIKQMYRDFLAVQVRKPLRVAGLPHAIVCDIDGTLALHNGRSPYDTAKCAADGVNEDVANVVRIYKALKRQIILVSGRDEKFRGETAGWLMAHGIPFDKLFMRPLDDKRKDNIIKQEIYDASIFGSYNVDFVLDDRDRVVDTWRQNGLTCFQVAEGDF